MNIQRYILLPEEYKIVEENINLVRHVVIKKLGVNFSQNEFEDQVQIGIIGLIKAVKTFDSNKNIKFSSYASRCIMNEILMYYREKKKYKEDVSLQSEISTGKSEKEAIFLEDVIEDKKSSAMEENIANQVLVSKAISIILNVFSFRIKYVILMAIAGISHASIGSSINLSRSRISRLASEVFFDFRQNFEEYAKQVSNMEVFKVTLENEAIKINFSTADVANFNQIFASFLQKINKTVQIIDFKIKVSKQSVEIYLPAEPAAFAFLGLLVKEIEGVLGKNTTN